MAIEETGAIFKSLEFDGEDLRDYGVYITGEAVFNAPERDVDVIAIPGRNGSFVRDNGRFNNITVTYPAGLYGSTEADFAQGISDLRNALCSRKGYKRLSDDYNPNEYREAVYKSGLEVTPETLRAGQFNLTFECKPQRFLTSGETAAAVTSGATLTNPTLFDAKPFIECKGYGNITLPDYQYIYVDNTPLGHVNLWTSETSYTIPASNSNVSRAKSFDGSLVASGDEIYLEECGFIYTLAISGSVSAMGTSAQSGFDYVQSDLSERRWRLYFRDIYLTKGTSSTKTGTATLTFTTSFPVTSLNVTCALSYDGNQTLTLTMTGGRTVSPRIAPGGWFGRLSAESTVNASGTLYLDCDSGIAWWDQSGSIVDANWAVLFQDELPVLKPGTNTITYDNTFTSFKIAPRWWIV